MSDTTTSAQAAEAEKRYCNICKKTCGHYTHQHEDWAKIEVEDD